MNLTGKIALITNVSHFDILVNNNAHPPAGSPVEQITDAAWREMMARVGQVIPFAGGWVTP